MKGDAPFLRLEGVKTQMGEFIHPILKGRWAISSILTFDMCSQSRWATARLFSQHWLWGAVVP